MDGGSNRGSGGDYLGRHGLNSQISVLPAVWYNSVAMSMRRNFLGESMLLATFTFPCVGDLNLGECVSGIYTWSLTAVGIAAFISILYGGWQLVVAFGNTGKVSEAIKRISNAVFGIVLLFASYLILETINPDLVGGTVNLPKITKGEKIIDPGSIDNGGNQLTEIKNFSVTPDLADLSDNTKLTFVVGIFSSASNFVKKCQQAGSTSSPTDVRPRYRVYFLNKPNAVKSPEKWVHEELFNKGDFGESGKTVSFEFKKKIKDVSFDPSGGNNAGQFYAVFYCFDGGRSLQLNESAPVTVRISP